MSCKYERMTYRRQSKEWDAENGAEGSDEFSRPSRRYSIAVAHSTQRYLQYKLN